MKNNCIVLVSMPIMRYAPGLTQLEALKNKEIKPSPLCKGKASVGGFNFCPILGHSLIFSLGL